MRTTKNNDLVINFRVKREDGNLFKHHCIDRKTTMSELLRKLMNRQVKTKVNLDVFEFDNPVEYINLYRHLEAFKIQNDYFYRNASQKCISYEGIEKLKELANEFGNCGFGDWATLILDLAIWQTKTDKKNPKPFPESVDRYYNQYVPEYYKLPIE